LVFSEPHRAKMGAVIEIKRIPREQHPRDRWDLGKSIVLQGSPRLLIQGARCSSLCLSEL
jgi:hypothetical protein